MSIYDRVEKLLLKAEIGKPLSRDEIIDLLKMPGDGVPDLFATADRVRKNEVGDEIFLRGIIEFSNHCERDCLYCGLRKGNRKLSRYRMTDEEILETVRNISRTKIPTVVLQSGEDSFYTTEKICGALGIQVEFVRSSSYGFEGSKEGEKIIQLCNALGCDHLINGPKAAEYMNQALFDAAGIDVRYMTYEYPEYHQLYRPFEHGVSVLDLLFNTGEKAPYYIWGWKDEAK